jgi:hypothetical protein
VANALSPSQAGQADASDHEGADEHERQADLADRGEALFENDRRKTCDGERHDALVQSPRVSHGCEHKPRADDKQLGCARAKRTTAMNPAHPSRSIANPRRITTGSSTGPATAKRKAIRSDADGFVVTPSLIMTNQPAQIVTAITPQPEPTRIVVSPGGRCRLAGKGEARAVLQV